jgi:hypothetical protein
MVVEYLHGKIFDCYLFLFLFDIFYSFLVGDGAKQWAQQHDFPLIDSQKMKTGFILLYQLNFLNIYRFIKKIVLICLKNTKEN